MWGSRGAWEANDFVAALPSGDVAGVWPDHLFASTFDHFQQVQEWDGKVWRPTPGLPATDLQPWIGGTVIGRAGSRDQKLTQAFVVYGRSSGAPAYVPKPSPDPKNLCPHRLAIQGYESSPSGDLVLWGKTCFPRETSADDFVIERFSPSGDRRTVAFAEPEPIVFSDALNGRPPVAARGPDSVWTIGVAAGRRWMLAHWNGTSVHWEATPFVDRDTFGASMAVAEDGTLWLAFAGAYANHEELSQIAQVWSRAPAGGWTRWAVPPAVHEGRPLHPHYLHITAVGDRIWFEKATWEERVTEQVSAIWWATASQAPAATALQPPAAPATQVPASSATQAP